MRWLPWTKPKLHMSYRRSPRFPPDLKSFLIRLNVLMDHILWEIEYSRTSLTTSYVLTDYEKIVLLLEDQRFFLHNGVDVWCVPRALKRFMNTGRLGGVSTIEQQLVRTILGYRERTLRRKFQEVILAIALSYRADKTELLRSYLSLAYHGYAITGCEEASKFLFDKEAVDLDRVEGALLASLLVYPLPKQIVESNEVAKFIPINDLGAYLEACEQVAPNWVRNVKRRGSHGLALLRKAEQTT
ncbi:MAG: hypothetical protein FJX44_00495 [Alphaproteobacteria bacterium]|nr:hypothetical protein [Alphaproteobacteria bacterium]